MYRSAAIFAVACLLAPSAAYGGVTVGNGASMSLGNGSLTMGCGDLVVAGVFSVDSGQATGIEDVQITNGLLEGGSGLLQLAGDWSNQGSFDAGTGTVQLTDGCGVAVSNVSGNSDFYTFDASTQSGKTLQLEAGSSQTFASSLALLGQGAANRLRIRSSAPGNQAFFSLAPSGSQLIDSVDVRDNNASGGQLLAPDIPAAFNSVDAGNNVNWFVQFVNNVPIPTLGPWGLALMALALAWLARRRLSPVAAKN